MKAFLLAALIFLTSCASGPCNEDAINIHKEIADVTSSVVLLAPIGTNDIEAHLLREAARVQTEAFEADFGVKIKPVRMYVLRGFTLPCGSDHTRRYIGCYKTRLNRIFLTMGYRYNLPALYHEYIHRMNPDHDVYHKDPRWKGEWSDRMKQINKDLLKSRRHVNLYKVRWGIK